MNAIAPNISLDALFRRNATLRGDLPALRDADGVSLTYQQTANAVAHLAEQIAGLGLPRGSAVALLLPSGRELVAALLAVLRSGHVPVPMPVAWRKSDLVRACREAETAALITTANYLPESLPGLVAETAMEVFELSFPCAFGHPLPDGLMPLSLETLSEPLFATTPLSDVAAPGIATLQPHSGGVSFVLHSDEELLAAGLGAMLAGDVRGGDAIVSAISLTSFAGLASVLVPWLLSSGCLSLLPDLPAAGAIDFDKNTHLIGTAGSLAALAGSMPTAIASVSAVRFAGTDDYTTFPALNANRVVDVVAIGEIAAIALPRNERSITAALPLGPIRAGNAGAGAPVIIETGVENNFLRLRGIMVPKDMLLDQPWLETSFPARMRDASSFGISAAKDLVAIGGLRFDLPDLERRIRAAALVGEIRVMADPLLGMKLVIASERPAETSKALLDAGLPRVIAASVRKTQLAHARAS